MNENGSTKNLRRMKKTLGTICVIVIMVVTYLALLLTIVVGAPVWAFTILASEDSSTQCNALKFHRT